jgi:hypothetical protein
VKHQDWAGDNSIRWVPKGILASSLRIASQQRATLCVRINPVGQVSFNQLYTAINKPVAKEMHEAVRIWIDLFNESIGQ